MKRSIPGSIYAIRGKIAIKLQGKIHYTGLKDTRIGRQYAENILLELYKKSKEINLIPEKKTPSIAEAFELFLNFKVNYYEKTRVTHRLAYKAIIKTNFILNKDDIEKSIINYINSTSHAPTSINIYLRHFNIFLNFCNEKNWLPKLQLKKNFFVKENRTEPEPYTEEEIQQFINFFKISKPEFSLFLEFMIETGCRGVDALTLAPDKIKNDSIIWSNKITKKPEQRPISKRAKEILDSLPERSDRIFIWSYSSFSLLHKWLKAAAKDLSIELNGRGFQEFRSAFRMKLLERGTPIEYVMYLMRHKHFNTTEIHYTQYKIENIKQFLE
jgi:integrase